MSLPRERRSSTVPASTIATYMMALRGEYCMAILVAPSSIAARFCFEFLPGGVLRLGAGEGVELAGLDAVDELAGLAVGGDEVEPAAGDEGVLVEAEDAVGDGVAVVVVVEEPAVEVLFAERRLNRVEVHPEQYAPPPVFLRKVFKREDLGVDFKCKILILDILRPKYLKSMRWDDPCGAGLDSDHGSAGRLCVLCVWSGYRFLTSISILVS